METPPQAVRLAGNTKGEELGLDMTEPCRGEGRKSYPAARAATGINPEARGPIHPDMPNLQPA